MKFAPSLTQWLHKSISKSQLRVSLKARSACGNDWSSNLDASLSGLCVVVDMYSVQRTPVNTMSSMTITPPLVLLKWMTSNENWNSQINQGNATRGRSLQQKDSRLECLCRLSWWIPLSQFPSRHNYKQCYLFRYCKLELERWDSSSI